MFLMGLFHVKSYKISGSCYPYLIGFFEIFTSGRYNRDMKALKILVSSISEFMVFLKMANWCASDDILNTTFSLITSVSNNLWS